MARGKHAAQVANRRYEGAMAAVAELADKVAVEKLRAREVEAEARRVPALVAKVADLQAQLAQATSRELEAVRGRVDKLEDAHARAVIALVNMINLIAKEHPDYAFITDEAIQVIESTPHLAKIRLTDLDAARRTRRYRHAGMTSALRAETALQDNRRTQRQNDANAHGLAFGKP